MTDDLEARLAEALRSRVQADPAEVGRILDSVVLPARRAPRRHPWSLVAAAVVAAFVVGSLALRLSNDRVAAPSPSPTVAGIASPSPSRSIFRAPSGPITASTSDGTFVLTITADHATYVPGDPITLTTTLTYVGPEGTVDVYGSGSGLVVFTIQRDHEKPIGGVNLQSCVRGPLESGKPVGYPFLKGAAYAPDDPQRKFIEDYLADPLLHLPAGTWHIRALFGGGLAGCSPDHEFQAAVTIVVSEPAAAPSATPPASARAGPTLLPDPAPLASDARYLACTGPGMPPVSSAFVVEEQRTIEAYLPDLAARTTEFLSYGPAFIVVYAEPIPLFMATPGGPGAWPSPAADRHDVCLVYGGPTNPPSTFFWGVSFTDFDPSPAGLPALP